MEKPPASLALELETTSMKFHYDSELRVHLQLLLCGGPCHEATPGNANARGGKKEGQRSNYGLPLSSVGRSRRPSRSFTAPFQYLFLSLSLCSEKQACLASIY